MNDKTHSKEPSGRAAQKKTDKPRHKLWTRLIGNLKRIVHQYRTAREERSAKRENETTEQQAARLTAKATKCIAIFTVVLAIVAILTLAELIQGGADTRALVKASQNQAAAAQQQACAAQHFADTAGLINGNINNAVGKLNTQAAHTKTLAEQATNEAQTMARQLSDFEAAQSADLVVSVDESMESSTLKNFRITRAKVTVTNAGTSAAKHLMWASVGGMWTWQGQDPSSGLITQKDEERIIKGVELPKATEGGISLGAGQSAHFDINLGDPDDLISIKRGDLEYVLVAYEDVFGNKKMACTPLLFSPPLHKYLGGRLVQEFCTTLLDAKKQQKQTAPN